MNYCSLTRVYCSNWNLPRNHPHRGVPSSGENDPTAPWGDLVLAGCLDRKVKNLCFAKFPTTPGTLTLFEAFCPGGGAGEKGQFHQLMLVSTGHEEQPGRRPEQVPFSSCLHTFQASVSFLMKSVLCTMWPNYWNFISCSFITAEELHTRVLPGQTVATSE